MPAVLFSFTPPDNNFFNKYETNCFPCRTVKAVRIEVRRQEISSSDFNAHKSLARVWSNRLEEAVETWLWLAQMASWWMKSKWEKTF